MPNKPKQLKQIPKKAKELLSLRRRSKRGERERERERDIYNMRRKNCDTLAALSRKLTECSGVNENSDTGTLLKKRRTVFSLSYLLGRAVSSSRFIALKSSRRWIFFFFFFLWKILYFICRSAPYRSWWQKRGIGSFFGQYLCHVGQHFLTARREALQMLHPVATRMLSSIKTPHFRALISPKIFPLIYGSDRKKRRWWSWWWRGRKR